MALLLIVVIPFVFSLPNMLMVRELQSMMPVEGGYYHWIKQAFGPFAGFMAGWMNWVMSWVDVSIYPVLAAYYLGYLHPGDATAPHRGHARLGAAVAGGHRDHLVISAPAGPGRAAGRADQPTGSASILLIPLVIMTDPGLLQLGERTAAASSCPSCPTDTGMTGAFSVGLFVVMWNYMGWELPTSAGDEIVKPRRTYPLAMVLVLIAAIATYAIPTVAALYGGAGDNNKVLLWGIEESRRGPGSGGPGRQRA